MPRRRASSSACPSISPAWYWAAGLHDACIVGVEATEFPFGHDESLADKQYYNRNCLTPKVDASGVMFDTAVKEIQLYNDKIVSEDWDLQGRKTIWWLADRLTKRDDRFVLVIDMQDFDSDPKEFTCAVRFERAEVART